MAAPSSCSWTSASTTPWLPDPEWVDYPTLLDFDAPRVLAYQPVTALAEKFETIVSRGLANSWLRDYYDL